MNNSDEPDDSVPYCIKCELPMFKGRALDSRGLHKSWMCSCGYLLERARTIAIQWPDGTTIRGTIE